MQLLEERIEHLIPIGKVYTAHDLENMPSCERYELIRGELCAMPNNSANHGNKTILLSAPITMFVVENDLGACFAAETRFTIEENPDTVLGPDFAFVSRARLEGIPPRGYLKLAPDLVIETRSPGDTRAEISYKVSRWLTAGSTLVWVLDPIQKILTVHRSGVAPTTLQVGDILSGEDVLPGFEYPMSKIFREIS